MSRTIRAFLITTSVHFVRYSMIRTPKGRKVTWNYSRGAGVSPDATSLPPIWAAGETPQMIQRRVVRLLGPDVKTDETDRAAQSGMNCSLVMPFTHRFVRKTGAVVEITRVVLVGLPENHVLPAQR